MNVTIIPKKRITPAETRGVPAGPPSRDSQDLPPVGREDAHKRFENALIRLDCWALGFPGKMPARRFPMKATGRSRSQPTRPARRRDIDRLQVRRRGRPRNAVRGRTGFLWTDGGLDGAKGIRLINIVGEAARMRNAAAVSVFAGRRMAPAAKEELDKPPFAVRGSHPDNGSEESGNGFTACGFFARRHKLGEPTRAINHLMGKALFRCLNFHRLRRFPVRTIDDPGRERVIHPDESIPAPLEKPEPLPEAEQPIKPGLSFEESHAIGEECDNDEAARLRPGLRQPRPDQVRRCLTNRLRLLFEAAARSGTTAGHDY